MSNAAKAYLATQVETTSQGQLLLMLYEACIKFLNRAKEEIERRDYAQKGIYISKAMAIIHELAESLNKEKGGQITERLNQLYVFCTFRLTKANIQMDTAKIDDVIRIMDGIRSAYAQVIPEHENGQGVTGQRPAELHAAAQAAQAAPRPPAEPQSYAPAAPQGYPAPVMPAPQGDDQPEPKAKPKAVNAAKLRAANAYSNANR